MGTIAEATAIIKRETGFLEETANTQAFTMTRWKAKYMFGLQLKAFDAESDVIYDGL